MLSRELHDEIGQNLTILGVNLNLLRSLIPKDSVEMIHSRINDSLVVVKQTTERIRNLMSNLRSPVLDDYGLVAAIDLYGKQWSSRTGIDIAVRGPETDTHLPAHVENAMFRIVQESLTNVVKHAKAEQVVITVGVTHGKVYLSVEDNGVGYDMSRLTVAKGERGWGMVTMSERALAVGGTCRVQSLPGLGTHVFVEVPV
jgi:signal transduction histidine kinase